MAKIILLPIQSAPAAKPVKLPLHVLQVIPHFVDISADASRPFNLFGALAMLLGSRGWGRVVVPQLWSPGRNLDQLRQAFPFGRDLERDLFSPSILVSQPPFVRETNTTPPQYEIIHILGRFVGGMAAYDANEDLNAVLSHTPLVMVRPGQVRDMALQHGTRLIILERPESSRPSDIDDFARAVAGGGGPAMLIVKDDNSQARDRFLTDTYEAIVHNQPLSSLARVQSDVNVDLYLGRSADRSFSFDGLMKQLRDDLRGLGREQRRPFLRRFDLQFRDQAARNFFIGSAQQYLHQQGVSSLSLRTKQIVDAARETMATFPQFRWDHESQGVIPLAEASDHLARAQDELERAAIDEVTQAPRVLNANFGTAEQKLPPNQPLVAGRTYDLLVDIGPRWQDGSIVTGNQAFPIQALPQGGEGHLIDVVFSTADFDPPMSRTQLWLPADFGASSPVTEEGQPSQPGPARLPVRVLGPADKGRGRSKTRARGRVCLYHENNLLQSATVSVGLAQEGEEKRSAQNRITVDFRLTGTFRGAGAQFAVRRLGEQERKVALNITLNDDGGGNHRILVNSGKELGAAWMPYDPKALKDALDRCRAELVNIFMTRKENGDATDSWVLNSSNGKTKRQFELDIYILARQGEQLFNAMMQQLQPESGNRVKWVRQLQKILSEPSVIQIARTGETPRQYVWPWALLYSYPLPNYGVANGVRYCDVLKKDWSDEGVRTRASDDRCPHEDEAWHHKDVLCPYGFWGLKHVLEQPLSPLKLDRGSPEKYILLDAAHTGNLSGADPIFGIGTTEDQGLDQQQIKRHLQALTVMFAPAPAVGAAGAAQNLPAVTRADLLTVLNRVGIGYFLCHGQTDTSQNEPYLGLGPNPGQPGNWIYPSTILSWARSTNPDVCGNWQARRPLVFINGCHTTDLTPGAMLNFVDAFATLGAGVIVGTEISIRLQVAIEMAQSILEGISKGKPLAETLHKARWALANKGNLLGLAYTLYGLADFHMEN